MGPRPARRARASARRPHQGRRCRRAGAGGLRTRRGTGVAGVAWAGATALRAGRIGPVELGVLVFLVLGVAGLLQGLPDALGHLPVSRASLERLAGLGGLPCPVAEQPLRAGVGPARRPRPTAPSSSSTNPPAISTRSRRMPCSRRSWSTRRTARCCGSPTGRRNWPGSPRSSASKRPWAGTPGEDGFSTTPVARWASMRCRVVSIRRFADAGVILQGGTKSAADSPRYESGDKALPSASTAHHQTV